MLRAQVLCNGFIPAVLAALCAYVGGLSDWPLGAQQGRLYTAAAGAFFGYYACCCGDTWASELGQLSETEPRLVTSLRPVRKVPLVPAARSCAVAHCCTHGLAMRDCRKLTGEHLQEGLSALARVACIWRRAPTGA